MPCTKINLYDGLKLFFIQVSTVTAFDRAAKRLTTFSFKYPLVKAPGTALMSHTLFMR